MLTKPALLRQHLPYLSRYRTHLRCGHLELGAITDIFYFSEVRKTTMGSTTDLEQQALAQFDRLVEAGELLWTEVTARQVASTPFNASTPHFSSPCYSL